MSGSSDRFAGHLGVNEIRSSWDGRPCAVTYALTWGFLGNHEGEGTSMKDFGEAYVQRQERKADERTNLRSGQHVLHLLLTVFTGGLWLPVWIFRSIRGNPRPYRDEIYRNR